MLEICYTIFGSIALICGFVGLGMVIYLGRSKGKEIDRFVHGREIASDSIFYKILRLPVYGGAFAWRWSAKRSHLLPIRDHFDKKFQRPFIVTYFMLMTSGVALIVLFVIDKFFLHVT